MEHVPVLNNEVVEQLAPPSCARILDLTLGAGGHSKALLEAAGPEAHLIALEVDPDAIELAEKTLQPFGSRARIVRMSYADALDLLKDGEEPFDTILGDLGPSSMQFDREDRGFSFRFDGPLDMRMNPDLPQMASDIVGRTSQYDLANLIYKYGEERKSRRVAKAIVEARKKQPIRTTARLAKIVRRAVGHSPNIDGATRTFQALRIAVNGELDNLERMLGILPDLLNPGGRVGIISFHSLEDRLVKTAFRDDHKVGRLERVTKKPITPTEDEITENPRSRSAKFRVAKKPE